MPSSKQDQTLAGEGTSDRPADSPKLNLRRIFSLLAVGVLLIVLTMTSSFQFLEHLESRPQPRLLRRPPSAFEEQFRYKFQNPDLLPTLKNDATPSLALVFVEAADSLDFVRSDFEDGGLHVQEKQGPGVLIAVPFTRTFTISVGGVETTLNLGDGPAQTVGVDYSGLGFRVTCLTKGQGYL
jgi:hypothetical protein